MTARPKTRKGMGFEPKTFQGMSKKRMASKSGSYGLRVPLKEGVTTPIQFLETPEDATEFEVHVFQEEGRWEFVPCAGDACPMCHSDETKVRGTSYRFLLNVYNLEAKRVQLLEGPQQLAQQVFYRYERSTSRFLKRTYEVTHWPTKPTSYGFELGEDPVVNTSKMNKLDHNEYLMGELKRYYGDELPTAGGSALDDDEDDAPRTRRRKSSSSRRSRR